ncbi:MAG: Cof-type HAD-IIB family hydrolase [Acetanaerobacterium sp.]
MTYKLIAVDMDDTLLSNDLTISSGNAQALKAACALGVQVVLCSGREMYSMMGFARQLGMIEYMVTYNGGAACRVDTGEQLFEHRVDAKTVRLLIDIGRRFDLPPQIYTEQGLLVECYNERVRYYEHEAFVEAAVVDDLKAHAAEGSLKVLFNADPAQLAKVQEAAQSLAGEAFDMFYSKPCYLEFVSIACNKGKTLSSLADRLGISADEIIAVGDSFNDLSMLRMAGMGVAMANAHPDIRRAADYITQSDNNHDGVAEVVERFILSGAHRARAAEKENE